jgi:hypothetical protein
MSWRVKQFLKKWSPIALVALVGWVGFTHWQRGGRLSVGSVVTSAKVAAVRIPVLGSYFRGSRGSYSSYRSSGRSYAYGGRSSRRHGRAHGRRHRRHR